MTTTSKLSQQSTNAAINFFGLAYPTEKVISMEQYEDFVELGIKAGYFVHPACCTDEVFTFLNNQRTNPNATFWETWNDVISRSQTELFLHACIHYASTYGTNYEMPTYIPNDKYIDLPFTDLKMILPATDIEMANAAMNVLQSGIALDGVNVNMMVEVLSNAYTNSKYQINVDNIKNKEVKTQICEKLKIYPNNGIELLRFCVYKITGSSMLIKSSNVINEIKNPLKNIDEFVNDFINFDDNKLQALASVFYRFKPLFLAFKKADNKLSPVINKIRRLATTYHKPLKAGVFESLMNPEYSLEYFTTEVMKETNIWKLFRAQSYLSEEFELMSLNSNETYTKSYIIRNGKVYTKTLQNTPSDNQRKFIAMSRLLVIIKRINEIFANYKEKSGKNTVRLPKNINLVVPTSEKQFIGNIPYGSYFDMNTNNFVGVYWRNEWGTHDYDLSYINLNHVKYGWNTSYKSDANDVVFSGDMTNANPEAVEMFYCAKNMPNGLFKLNRFNGAAGSQARIFFGHEKITDLKRNYMVNPSSITFKADIFPELRETIIGGVFNNRVYIFSLESGNQHVSSMKADELQAVQRKLQHKIIFEELLMSAGFTILPADDTTTEADIDFSDYTKDQFITFFSDVIKNNESV